VSARRRRGLLLLAVALASGGLAASEVHEQERRAAEQLGPPVDVLVAARELRAGERVRRGAVAIRRVPARFVPPDVLSSAAGVVGARPAVPVVSGGYLGAGLFEGGEGGRGSDGLRRGERAVTVEVAGGAAMASLVPGVRVDVLVSTDGGTGRGLTTMALGGVELLRLGEAGTRSDSSGAPTALATLRVSLRQAIYLTAADNFAREIRVLARPPGDHSRAGGSYSASAILD
jgi:pilus assembly protein CpaB